MEIDGARICRLCFEICKCGFEIIEDTTLNTLHFVLPNLDLGISHEPVVCISCIHNLKECSDFKTGYLRRDHSSIKSEGKVLNASKICLGESVEDADAAACNSDVCCFCMEAINRELLVFLQSQGNNTMMMLEKCFPEVVLDVTEDSAVCAACYQSLQSLLAFINSCLAAEEKIREYCSVEGTNSKGQVELNDVLKFTSKNQLQSKIPSNLYVVKIEECWKQTDNEDEFKVEGQDFMEIEEQKLNCSEYEDIDIKTTQDGSGRFGTPRTKHENDPKLTIGKSSSEVIMYKCSICMYQTKRKRDLARHMSSKVHKSTSEVTMYKCETCDFQTSHRYSLRQHMLIHKDTSDVARFKCETCDYITKHKRTLQVHILTHKSTSEVTMYKCKMCEYKTKYKNNLHQHMVTHKNISEVASYKCETCDFLTKYKRTMELHILTHKSTAEVTMYKCEMCKYQTKYKSNLHQHVVTHKNISDVASYKCETCGFLTKHKRSLQVHILTHKSTSPVTMYKCDTCEFQTKRARYLELHVLTHESPSNVPVYKCEVCDFHTKHKPHLPLHMLTHKDPSEVTMYKCDVCEYQCKWKRSLLRHMLFHKSPA